VSKLKHVNSTDIRAAIELGCRTMSSDFNADDNDIPFFRSTVLPEARLSFSEIHSESHVPGRHLNALLNAEDAAGTGVPEAAIARHERAALFSYSGSIPLPLNRTHIGGPLISFTEHNVREGFHALYALAKFRDSAQARELAEASIAAIRAYWDPERGWERERLEREHGVRWTREHTFITGLGRSIGPLVKYFRATGYGPALDLALLLGQKATAEFFGPEGAYDPGAFGTHTHSTTCVMSSLAQLAELIDDATMMANVRAFYDNGLNRIRDELGWVIESSAEAAPPDLGECNNTGDIVETALILGRSGLPEYYHDAERILRGHLLPSQLRDNSFITDPPNPTGEDGLHNVAARHLGAFGFPAPYGHRPVGVETVSFNMDIVGGAVGSLCEANRAVVDSGPAGHRVNLLFDHETDSLKIEATYGRDALRVTPRRAGPLWIRIPPWADLERLSFDGAGSPPRLLGSHVFVAEPQIGHPVSVRYPLPQTEIVLGHRTRDIHVRLRGDQVAAMDNFGADLAFFDSM